VTRIQTAFYLALLAAALSLAAPAAAEGWWGFAAATLLLTGLWAGLRHRTGAWLASLSLFLLTAAASVGFLAGLPAGWMLAACVASMAAWDLDRFLKRIQKGQLNPALQALAADHIKRLVVVLAAGLLAGQLALNARFTISLIPTMVLALLLLYSLARLIREH
jgi:hypothetical protein